MEGILHLRNRTDSVSVFAGLYELKAMNKNIYLSYDRLNDIWRTHVLAQVVGGLIRPRIMIPSADWSDIKGAKTEIRHFLETTTVTVVLIDSKTSEQPWVEYELAQSIARGNGLLGIYIHCMEDHSGNASFRGLKPFVQDGICFPAYDWDQNPRHFWREVRAAAKRSAQSKKCTIIYFPSLGW